MTKPLLTKVLTSLVLSTLSFNALAAVPVPFWRWDFATGYKYFRSPNAACDEIFEDSKIVSASGSVCTQLISCNVAQNRSVRNATAYLGCESASGSPFTVNRTSSNTWHCQGDIPTPQNNVAVNENKLDLYDQCAEPPAPENPKEAPGDSCPSSDNPISYSSGNKFLSELDYRFASNQANTNALTIARFYNSTSAAGFGAIQGQQWRSHYQRFNSGSTQQAFLYRHDGRVLTIEDNGSGLTTDADINDQISYQLDSSGLVDSWAYTVDKTGITETYDAKGKLIELTSRAGLTQSLIYNSDNRLIEVVDDFGRKLTYTYDEIGRIAIVTNPAGGEYSFTYDADLNLTSITYPDGTTKSYHYNESSHVAAQPNAGVSLNNVLTGVTDENQSRFASYDYDANGRAYSEALAGGVKARSITYNTDGNDNPTSSVVVDARGNSRVYAFQTILNVAKDAGHSQPAGAGCAASAKAMDYDANGNVSSKTDFNGNRTDYTYDLARNLEISRTEGLSASGATTTASRTIITTWHSTWHLPTEITEYSGASASGTPLKRTTIAYDAKGNMTSRTVADPVRNISRTTTTIYTYSSTVPGLVLTKVVDGPRTDVSDTTTYQYYAHDASCTASTADPIIDPNTGTSPTNFGCRGQLQSIGNALGHTTTYDRYNHHGQLEQMTSPNGLVTTYTYDLRQRVLSETVGSETTSLVYDDAGQILELILPDSSTLTYLYDDAHRMTDIYDVQGNNIHYTLDLEGNRTNEVIKDPQGVLTKTVARSFDALNRMQTLTGIE